MREPLIGGALFGIAWLCVVAAMSPNVFVAEIGGSVSALLGLVIGARFGDWRDAR